MLDSVPPMKKSSWTHSFYRGDRLLAEVSLLASGFTASLSREEVTYGISVIRSSYGCTSAKIVGPFNQQQSQLSSPISYREAREQYLFFAEYPDALLLLFLHHRHSLNPFLDSPSYIKVVQRLAMFLHAKYPSRPDLPFQILMREPTGVLLRSTPRQFLRPGLWYTTSNGFLLNLQALWVQGFYESMWLGFLTGQIDGRYFPFSDHHIRGFSIIGEDERCLELFKQLYEQSPAEFYVGSISNILFIALGIEQPPQAFVNTLVKHFDRLAQANIADLPDNPPLPQRLEVQERPLMVVVSSDLRNHPVGRFWLPIARRLRSRFRLIHVAGNPNDSDPIRTELRELSDEWWPLQVGEVADIARRIRSHAPALLLDLGGHTADNHPSLLAHRLAVVQATYLGFYGPTYATCCDWWIVDQVLQRWLVNSYPGAEPLWALPGPSLCYLPSLHGLPDPQDISYREPNNLVFGSFNHTRKLTRASQKRFGEVLHANPDAVLQFRSHSFHDPAVRRGFLIRLQDMGIAPHQLQPLPYAPSSSAAMADFGRIHLHFDTFPVSGTTTTLDSLAMGIPVLTCPTPYYAGAISAAILEHAGLADHICSEPSQLPAHARWLAERYHSAAARRSLAKQVRQSQICDDQVMPSMFVDQLQRMLRQAIGS